MAESEPESVAALRSPEADSTLSLPDDLKPLADRIIDLRRQDILTPACMAHLLDRLWSDMGRLERAVAALEAVVS